MPQIRAGSPYRIECYQALDYLNRYPDLSVEEVRKRDAYGLPLGAHFFAAAYCGSDPFMHKMKEAVNTPGKRRLSWGQELAVLRVLREDGLP